MDLSGEATEARGETHRLQREISALYEENVPGASDWTDTSGGEYYGFCVRRLRRPEHRHENHFWANDNGATQNMVFSNRQVLKVTFTKCRQKDEPVARRLRQEWRVAPPNVVFFVVQVLKIFFTVEP